MGDREEWTEGVQWRRWSGSGADRGDREGWSERGAGRAHGACARSDKERRRGV